MKDRVLAVITLMLTAMRSWYLNVKRAFTSLKV